MPSTDLFGACVVECGFQMCRPPPAGKVQRFRKKVLVLLIAVWLTCPCPLRGVHVAVASRCWPSWRLWLAGGSLSPVLGVSFEAD